MSVVVISVLSLKQIIPWYEEETYTYQVEAMEAPTNLTENGMFYFLELTRFATNILDSVFVRL